MKKVLGLFVASLLIFSVSYSCKEKVKPFSERIAKVWLPRIVKENSTIVYSNGSTSNIKPAYSSYRLNLSSPPQAVITEVDGNTYTGTYSIQNDTKIVVSGLNPEPTGSNGVLEYTINSLAGDDSELLITLDGLYPKTGNTTNQYTLIFQ